MKGRKVDEPGSCQLFFENNTATDVCANPCQKYASMSSLNLPFLVFTGKSVTVDSLKISTQNQHLQSDKQPSLETQGVQCLSLCPFTSPGRCLHSCLESRPLTVEQ